MRFRTLVKIIDPYALLDKDTFYNYPLTFKTFGLVNKLSSKKKTTKKLERAVDGTPSQIPTLKVLTPSTPKPTPGALPRRQNESSVRYV